MAASGLRLIGRERELDALSGLLSAAETRLVTVTGPPGVGKTRVAHAVAAANSAAFRDGVFTVDLSRLEDPGLVLRCRRRRQPRVACGRARLPETRSRPRCTRDVHC